MRELEARFGSLGGARVSHLDGLKVDFPTWWMSVRPSANDPVLRLRVEGSSHEEMTARRDEIVNMLYARGAVQAS
ncbi:hypothetical protein HYV72_00480 [Candidatus Uhrbacteria bacterium]|nr:hypothetical protein [Candidatus Uhrbacteria bacterium]